MQTVVLGDSNEILEEIVVSARLLEDFIDTKLLMFICRQRFW